MIPGGNQGTKTPTQVNFEVTSNPNFIGDTTLDSSIDRLHRELAIRNTGFVCLRKEDYIAPIAQIIYQRSELRLIDD